MTSFLDCSVGYATEDVFKTYETPDRWIEFTKESLTWNKDVKQGKGMRVGSRVARSGRRVVVTGEGKGDIEVEIASKGLGSLWTAGVGTSVSNLVSTGLYQQVHTLGDTLPSLTIQKGIPRVDGTVDAYSYLGCTVDSFEIDSPNADILTSKFSFDVADYTTTEDYESPSYPAEPVDLFHWGQGVAEIGGTLTPATTTELASMVSEISVGIRNFNCQVSNSTNGKRFNYGNGGRKSKQVIGGYREIKGKFTAEYDQVTLRNANLNDTDLPLLITFTSGTNVFQVALPVIRLEGDDPQAGDGDLITVDHSFTLLDGLVAAEPFQIVQRTADAAL